MSHTPAPRSHSRAPRFQVLRKTWTVTVQDLRDEVARGARGGVIQFGWMVGDILVWAPVAPSSHLLRRWDWGVFGGVGAG